VNYAMHPVFLILILALAQTAPQVTVTTDQSSYAPGDRVTITVSASGLDANETLSLWLYVDKPNLHNLYFTELPINGDAILVDLPQDAMVGNYSVAVTWDHQIAETSFMVVMQTETQTTTTGTNTTSSLVTQTESTSTEPAIEPVNLWPAFAFMGFVTGFCVAVIVLAIAKRIKK